MLQCRSRDGQHPCIPLEGSDTKDGHQRIGWPEAPLELDVELPAYTELKIERKSVFARPGCAKVPPRIPFRKSIVLFLLFNSRAADARKFLVNRLITSSDALKFNEFGILVLNAETRGASPGAIEGALEISYWEEQEGALIDICFDFHISLPFEEEHSEWGVFMKKKPLRPGEKFTALDSNNNLCSMKTRTRLHDPTAGHNHDNTWAPLRFSHDPDPEYGSFGSDWRFELTEGRLSADEAYYQIGVTPLGRHFPDRYE